MKTIIIFLISATCLAQTYGEIRGGSITNVTGGGIISAGLTQHLNKVSLSALFSAYTLGGNSYDSYDLEGGYIIGNDRISISPIIGLGYDNERSYGEDGLSPLVGISSEFNLQGHKIGIGSRVRNGIQTAYMSVKLRLIFSKNKHKRFF